MTIFSPEIHLKCYSKRYFFLQRKIAGIFIISKMLEKYKIETPSYSLYEAD